MHNTLPVAPEKKRLLVTPKLPKLMDNEEMIVIKVTPTEKETYTEE